MGPCGALGVGPLPSRGRAQRYDRHSNTHAVDLTIWWVLPVIFMVVPNENDSTSYMVKKCVRAIIINITCNLEEALEFTFENRHCRS